MSPSRSSFVASLAALLLGLSSAVSAQTPPPDGDQLKAQCAANPDQCEAMKARAAEAKAKCAADPNCASQAEAGKQKMEALKAQCEANPKLCEQKKAELKAKRAELKAECEADPEACAEKKTQLREQLKAKRAAQSGG